MYTIPKYLQSEKIFSIIFIFVIWIRHNLHLKWDKDRIQYQLLGEI